jgi:MFS family permease
MLRANASTGSSPGVVASSGLAALALAMGIGRFAFTPILPMMLEDAGITVVQGALLASANYLGYLLGGLSAMRGGLGQRFAIRFGLLAIAVTTLAMGFADSFAAWIVLRALSGFASAWVLVFVSAWSLDLLGKAGRADLTGTVYAGVGSGIVFTGLACLALSRARLPSSAAWEALGIAALPAPGPLWPASRASIRPSWARGSMTLPMSLSWPIFAVGRSRTTPRPRGPRRWPSTCAASWA